MTYLSNHQWKYKIRRAINLSLYFVDRILGRTSGLVVLCYHSVSSDNWHFSIDPKTLELQMKEMLKDYQPMSVSELYSHLSGKRRLSGNRFAVTFDDGYHNILSSTATFKQLGIKPIAFIISDKKHIARHETKTDRKMLIETDLLRMASSDWEVGSHSCTHRNLAKLNDEGLASEVKQSKTTLSKATKKLVNFFAYPNGHYSQRVVEVVSRNYQLAFSMDDEVISDRTNPMLVPRIGVNRTHDIAEFKSLSSPSVILMRKLIKKTPLRKLYE